LLEVLVDVVGCEHAVKTSYVFEQGGLPVVTACLLEQRAEVPHVAGVELDGVPVGADPAEQFPLVERFKVEFEQQQNQLAAEELVRQQHVELPAQVVEQAFEPALACQPVQPVQQQDDQLLVLGPVLRVLQQRLDGLLQRELHLVRQQRPQVGQGRVPLVPLVQL